MFIQLEISEKQAVRLQDHTDTYNRTNNTLLTLEQWIDLHLKEVAIQGLIAPNLDTLEADVSKYRADRVQEIIQQAIQSL